MIDQLTLGVRLRDEADFSSFFAGNNEEIVTALKKHATVSEWSCLYIAGPPGSGKSHLLQASCQHAISHGLTAFYLPLNVDLSPLILEGLDIFSLVCIDDIDSVASDPKWEEAIFHFFNRSLAHNTRLLFAAEKTAGLCQFKLRDLSSRLASGLTYALKALNDCQKRKMLQLRAHLRGFELTEEVCGYLLNHYSRKMNDLMTLLDCLDQASFKAQHRVTIPFIKSILNSRVC